MTSLILKSMQQAKRLVIAVAGFTVLVAGIAMIVLPGPALLVMPAGFGILATEFIWARRLLVKSKSSFNNNIRGGNINETE